MSGAVVRGAPDFLRPPVEVALAQPRRTLPLPAEVPGGARYEPKWDGFRLVVFVGAEGVELQSRAGKPLTRYFPEIVAAAAEQLSPGLVLDGEVVVWNNGRLDFAALQRRLTAPPERAGGLAAPAAFFVAFDVLAVGGLDLRAAPYVERRGELETLAPRWRPPLHLTPATADPMLAIEWLTDFAATGLEGVVVKGAAGRYRGGKRDWIKVRARHSTEAVVGAVLGSASAPRALVLGLPGRDGVLRVVGRTPPLSSAQSRQLAALLTPASRGHPWPGTLARALLGELAGPGKRIAIARVEPRLVVEVAADVGFERGRYRRALPLLRPRPDLDPADVRPPTT